MAFHTKTVLAVDDDPDILRLVRTILMRRGFSVVAASSAEEALELFASLEHPPDLLLTDIVMPGLNGPALAERLLLQQPGLRILYMSGFDNRQNAPLASPLLPKPFTPDVLGSKVEELLFA